MPPVAEVEQRAAYNVDAPYFHVEQALRSAYGTFARDIVKVSSFLREMRGGSVRTKQSSGLTVWDRHAQAAMTMQFVERHLPAADRLIIEARHTIPITIEMYERKAGRCAMLTDLLKSDVPQMDAGFVLDSVRVWAGMPRKRADLWWCDHLNVGERQLRHWRYGRKDRPGKGVFEVLNERERSAFDKLRGPMFEAGLTRQED